MKEAEKLPPTPGISRGSLEHCGRGRILLGGPSGSTGATGDLLRVPCPAASLWDGIPGWDFSHKDALSIPRAMLALTGGGGRHPGWPARAASDALGSSLPKLGKEKGHPGGSALPSGYLYAQGWERGAGGRGGRSGASDCSHVEEKAVPAP